MATEAVATVAVNYGKGSGYGSSSYGNGNSYGGSYAEPTGPPYGIQSTGEYTTYYPEKLDLSRCGPSKIFYSNDNCDVVFLFII